MVIGWSNLELAQLTENDEGIDGAIHSELVVDERTSIPLQNSNTNQVVVVLFKDNHICCTFGRFIVLVNT